MLPVPPTVGVVRPDGDGAVLTVGADDLDLLAGELALLALRAGLARGLLDRELACAPFRALERTAKAAGKTNMEFRYFDGLDHGLGTIVYFNTGAPSTGTAHSPTTSHVSSGATRSPIRMSRSRACPKRGWRIAASGWNW